LIHFNLDSFVGDSDSRVLVNKVIVKSGLDYFQIRVKDTHPFPDAVDLGFNEIDFHII